MALRIPALTVHLQTALRPQLLPPPHPPPLTPTFPPLPIHRPCLGTSSLSFGQRATGPIGLASLTCLEKFQPPLDWPGLSRDAGQPQAVAQCEATQFRAEGMA